MSRRTDRGDPAGGRGRGLDVEVEIESPGRSPLSPARRWAGAVGATAVGGLLAAAQLVGSAAATESPPPRSEPLDLTAYCRHRFGDDAAALPTLDQTEPDRLRCSVPRNGVWGLEPVLPLEACRWQRGAGARFELEEARSGNGGVRWLLLCVV